MVAETVEPMPWHQEPYSVDDLLRLDDGWHRYEVWEGALIVSPPPGAPHQRFADRLQNVLETAAPERVEVLTGVGVRLRDDDTAFVPDLVIRGAGDPDAVVFDAKDLLVAVEVVSPGSRRKDRISKPAEYASAGIPWYWRVELDTFPDQGGDALPVVLVHRLEGGYYRLEERASGGAVRRINSPFPVEFDPAALLRPR